MHFFLGGGGEGVRCITCTRACDPPAVQSTMSFSAPSKSAATEGIVVEMKWRVDRACMSLVPTTDLSEVVAHPDGEQHCIVCNELTTLVCAKCRATPYCSAACQKLDWSAVHKKACAVVRAMEAGAGEAAPVPEGLTRRDIELLRPFFGSRPAGDHWDGAPPALHKLATMLDPTGTGLAVVDAKGRVKGGHLASAGHRRLRITVRLHAVTADGGPDMNVVYYNRSVVEVCAGLWWGQYDTMDRVETVTAVAPLSTWVWIVGAGLAMHSTLRGINLLLTALATKLSGMVRSAGRVMKGFTITVYGNDEPLVSTTGPWRS
jgi:hypothetical protein